ncbi:hypothetical protein ACG83_41500 [Frankia sp. R43]|uniref:DUF3846 domain-containing protein n=1 Tax=Frankia sp. R43 TaxID=269536 RepID=UPI0006CA0C6E|nr:DUF3846 domain-containing protein [Frankia sp. R43]KPM50229.1 hypothetical protein ACG83_41500 [Frankia sp. R43]
MLVPADPLLPVRPVDHDETSLRAAQALVGGPIEPIGLTRPAATLYVNQNGKPDGLPRNGRATLLTWVHVQQLRGQDVIVGDAYLAGPERRGLDTDTPAALLAVLTGTAVQVQTRSRRRRRWMTLPSTVGMVYDEPFDAYATALLALDDQDILDVRVIPTGQT